MTFTDQILERLGVKYEDLNSTERETLNTWLGQLGQNQVTLESVRVHVTTMKAAVEEQLAKTDHDTKQDIFLKARLRNYMLLESFLSSHEKAKKAVEQAIAGLASPKI